jgi:hypothetical protein
MADELEAGVNEQINAVDMVPGQVYFNAAGSIKVCLLEKKDDVVWVQAYSDLHQEWRKVKVEETYKLRIPTKGELIMAETAEKEVKVKVAKEKAPPKNLGKVRGLKMLATWGQVYKDVGTEGIESVKAAMLEEFPDRAESIERWARAYRIYYNTGRLPGVDKPAEPIVWVAPERTAKLEERKQKALAKLEEKEAKKALKEEEKAAKKAAKEEARAQAAAAKKESGSAILKAEAEAKAQAEAAQ